MLNNPPNTKKDNKIHPKFHVPLNLLVINTYQPAISHLNGYSKTGFFLTRPWPQHEHASVATFSSIGHRLIMLLSFLPQPIPEVVLPMSKGASSLFFCYSFCHVDLLVDLIDSMVVALAKNWSHLQYLSVQDNVDMSHPLVTWAAGEVQHLAFSEASAHEVLSWCFSSYCLVLYDLLTNAK